jgi:glycosyltransferase involved in cell wall biosynthesis
VIPCFNSASTLHELHKRLVATCSTVVQNDFEIVFIDDGSSDDTWEMIRSLSIENPKVKGLKLSRNFGQHKAIMAGLRQCSGDWVAIMDADLQDDPSDIPRLISAAIESRSEVALAKRVRKQHSLIKKIGSLLFSSALSLASGIKSSSSVGNFGVYSRKVIDEIKNFGDRDFLIGHLVIWTGFSNVQVEVVHRARQSGASTYNFKSLFSLGYSVLMSSSDFPLRSIAALGAIFLAGSLSFGVVIVARYFSGGPAPEGWTSLILTLLICTSILMLSLGVVGLYVARLFELNKKRPLFVVSEKC